LPFRDVDSSLRDIADAIGMIDIPRGPEVGCRVGSYRSLVKRLFASAVTPRPAAPAYHGGASETYITYDRIKLPVMWQTVRVDLPSLKAAVLRALNRPA